MSEPVPQTAFLDVQRLLHSSAPRPRSSWVGYGTLALLLVVLMTALLVGRSDANRAMTQLLSAGAMLGIVVAMAVLGVKTVKRHRAAQAMVDAAGELAQLRRWPQAGLVLEQVLSRPMPTHPMRTQALVYLSSVLSRYHRFEDAIAVHNHLLDNELVDDAIGFGVRAARAMAMLRDDHLFDADRAISELRRLQGPEEAAPLALVEIFRDVKTGHPDEAIQLFETKLPMLRDQLGHRLADAYALAARAYDVRERKAEAHDAWAKATMLAPAGELLRRYPEVKPVADNYPATAAPADALG